MNLDANQATGNGGGIASAGADVSFSNSTFSNNKANGGAGGAIWNGSALTLNGSALFLNSGAVGGAIANDGSAAGGVALTLVNNTLNGNTAASGGGIANLGSATLNSNTNTISSNSGGIANTGGAVSLSNTLLAGNSGGAECSGTISSLDYNLFGIGEIIINRAIPGDTIMLAAGTYNENLTLSRNVSLLGAGADTTSIRGSQNGAVITINAGIQANLSGLAVRGGTGFSGDGIANSGTLTITGGLVDPNSAPPSVLEDLSSPTIDSVAFGSGDAASGITIAREVQVSISAGASDEGSGIQHVSATYTADGRNWQRVELAPTANGEYGYSTKVAGSSRKNDGDVFFEVVDAAGNVTIAARKTTLLPDYILVMPPIRK